MRRSTEADVPAITDCLSRRPELAMFPLSNLARYGFEGDHDYGPFFWIAEQGGAVTDVLSITRSGMVMPYLPSGDIAAARAATTGRAIIGVIGAAPFARPLAEALGVTEADCTLMRDEPQYVLDLADLVIPDLPGHLIPLAEADRAMLEQWRIDYDVEALGMDRAQAEAQGGDEIDRYIAQGTHKALMVDGQVVAQTGFNATLPEIVQIGGVYTPPAHRNKGHARRAVALHLAEARSQGVTRATLFSANAAASRAYEAIGFRRIGAWSLILTKAPLHV